MGQTSECGRCPVANLLMEKLQPRVVLVDNFDATLRQSTKDAPVHQKLPAWAQTFVLKIDDLEPKPGTHCPVAAVDCRLVLMEMRKEMVA